MTAEGNNQVELKQSRTQSQDRSSQSQQSRETKSYLELSAQSALARPETTAVRECIEKEDFNGGLDILLGIRGEKTLEIVVTQLDLTSDIQRLFYGFEFEERWNARRDDWVKVLAVRSAYNLSLHVDVALKGRTKSKKYGLPQLFKKGQFLKRQRADVSNLRSQDAYDAFQLLRAMPINDRLEYGRVPATGDGEISNAELMIEMHRKLNKSMVEVGTSMYGSDGTQASEQMMSWALSEEFWFNSDPRGLEASVRLFCAAGLRERMLARLELWSVVKGLGRLTEEPERKLAIQQGFGVQDPMGAASGDLAVWVRSLRRSDYINDDDFTPETTKPLGILGDARRAKKSAKKQYKEDLKRWRKARREAEASGKKFTTPKPVKPRGLLRSLRNKKNGFSVKNFPLDQVEGLLNEYGQGGTFDLTNYGKRKGDKRGLLTNTANISFDPNRGKLELTISDAQLESVRFPYEDFLVSSGKTSGQNLVIVATWPTAQSPAQESSVKIKADSLIVNDLVVMLPGWADPEGNTRAGQIIAADRVELTGVAFSRQENEIDLLTTTDGKEVDGAEEVIEAIGKSNPFRPLWRHIWSEKIYEQQKDIQQAFLGNGASALGSASFTVDDAKIEGLSIDGVSTAAEAELQCVKLAYSRKPSVVASERIAELERRIAGAEIQLEGFVAQSEIDRHRRERLAQDVLKWKQEESKLKQKLDRWRQLEDLYQEIYEFGKTKDAAKEAGVGIQVTALTRHIRTAAKELGVYDSSFPKIAENIVRELEPGPSVSIAVEKAELGKSKFGSVTSDSSSVNNLSLVTSGRLREIEDYGVFPSLDASALQGEAVANKAVSDGDVSLDVESLDMNNGTVESKLLTAKAIEEDLRKLDFLREKGASRTLEEDRVLEEQEIKFGRSVGRQLTYESVARTIVALEGDHGLEAIRNSTYLSAEYYRLQRLLVQEVVRFENASLDGVYLTAETSESEFSSSASVGETHVTNGVMGDRSVDKAYAIGTYANASSHTNEEGKLDQISASTGISALRAQGFNNGDGLQMDEAGAEGLSIVLESGELNTSASFSLRKLYTEGVRTEQRIALLRNRQGELRKLLEVVNETGGNTEGVAQQLEAVRHEIQLYESLRDQLKALNQKIAALESQISVVKEQISNLPKSATKRQLVAQKDELQLKKVALDNEAHELVHSVANYEKSFNAQEPTSLQDFSVNVAMEKGVSDIVASELSTLDLDFSGEIEIALKSGPLSVPTLRLSQSEREVSLAGASIPSFIGYAKVEIDRNKDPSQASFNVFRGATLKSFDIPDVRADEFSISDKDGEILQHVPNVSITGLKASGIELTTLDFDKMKYVPGKLELESVTASASDMENAMRGGLRVSGVTLESLSDGTINYELESLDVDGIAEHLGYAKSASLDGFSVKGDFSREDGSMLTTFGVDEVSLHNLDFGADDYRLKAGRAALSGVNCVVSSQWYVVDGHPPNELKNAHVEELTVDEMSVENFSLVQNKNGVESFGNGSKRAYKSDTDVSMRLATLRGVELKQFGSTGFEVDMKGGSVKGFSATLKENGKQVLQANANATLKTVNVKSVGEITSVGLGKLNGDANVTFGKDGAETSLQMTDGGITNVAGRLNHVTGVSHFTGDAYAKNLDFEQGVVGSGYSRPHSLGSADLRGIEVTDSSEELVVSIASGEGSFEAEHNMNRYKSGGTYDKENKDEAYVRNRWDNDQIAVTMSEKRADITAIREVDGALWLTLPGGFPLARLDVADGRVSVNMDEGIKRIFEDRIEEIQGTAWYIRLLKLITSLTHLENAATVLKASVLKVLELYVNKWGLSYLGGWHQFGDKLEELLERGGSLEEILASPTVTTELGQVLANTMAEGVSWAEWSGILYDAFDGDWGRLTATSLSWVVKKTGQGTEWVAERFGYEDVTNWDEGGDMFLRLLAADRKRDAEAMFQELLKWLMDVQVTADLSGKGPVSLQSRQPGATSWDTTLSTDVSMVVKGGGSAAAMSFATSFDLCDLSSSQGGQEVSLNHLHASTSNLANETVVTNDGTGRIVEQVDLNSQGDIQVAFEGLTYRVDKKEAKKAAAFAPEGSRSQSEAYNQFGRVSSKDGPVYDGDRILYDKEDYHQRVQTSQSPTYGTPWLDPRVVDPIKNWLFDAGEAKVEKPYVIKDKKD